MSVGSRIREARGRKRIRQRALAEMIGAHPVTISRWERGVNLPDSGTLSRIAEVLETTVAYLSGEAEDLSRFPAADGALSGLRSNARFIETINIPIVSKVIKACCGEGNAYADDIEWEIEGALALPANDLMGYTWQVGKNGFHAIAVEGDSMEPRIHDGDIIVFASSLEIQNGNFVLVKYDGRILIRAFWDNGKGHFRLKALNPNYEDIEIDSSSEDEGREFIILGKVLRRVTVDNLANGVM